MFAIFHKLKIDKFIPYSIIISKIKIFTFNNNKLHSFKQDKKHQEFNF